MLYNFDNLDIDRIMLVYTKEIEQYFFLACFKYWHFSYFPDWEAVNKKYPTLIENVPLPSFSEKDETY